MKIMYINKETGKEVHYGESITFKESGELSNGYSYSRETTLPIINRTIPYLIEKGLLIQKEVKDEKENTKSQTEFTIEKKVDTLIVAVSTLLESVAQLQKDCYKKDND